MAGVSAIGIIQAIAAIIGAGAAVKASTNETNISEDSPGSPAGETFGGAGPFNSAQTGAGAGDIGSILASITGGVPALDTTAAQQTAAATAAASKVPPSSPNLPAPGDDEVGPPVDRAGSGTTEPAQDIGKILAAIPQALVAAGSLLGINDQDTRTQRPAPVAGGGGGGLVGQFNRPIGQSPDIGRLLAALPGLL